MKPLRRFLFREPPQVVMALLAPLFLIGCSSTQRIENTASSPRLSEGVHQHDVAHVEATKPSSDYVVQATKPPLQFHIVVTNASAAAFTINVISDDRHHLIAPILLPPDRIIDITGRVQETSLSAGSLELRIRRFSIGSMEESETGISRTEVLASDANHGSLALRFGLTNTTSEIFELPGLINEKGRKTSFGPCDAIILGKPLVALSENATLFGISPLEPLTVNVKTNESSPSIATASPASSGKEPSPVILGYSIQVIAGFVLIFIPIGIMLASITKEERESFRHCEGPVSLLITTMVTFINRAKRTTAVLTKMLF